MDKKKVRAEMSVSTEIPANLDTGEETTALQVQMTGCYTSPDPTAPRHIAAQSPSFPKAASRLGLFTCTSGKSLGL